MRYQAKLVEVDPGSCYPIKYHRALVRSGIDCPKKSLTGQLGKEHASHADNEVCLKLDRFITVVETKKEKEYVVTGLTDILKMTKTVALMTFDQTPTWFCVVDGFHRIVAVKELRKKKTGDWRSVSLRAMLLPLADPILLRAVRRLINFDNSLDAAPKLGPSFCRVLFRRPAVSPGLVTTLSITGSSRWFTKLRGRNDISESVAQGDTLVLLKLFRLCAIGLDCSVRILKRVA